MVNIPPIKMMMTWGWFIYDILLTTLYKYINDQPHYGNIFHFHQKKSDDFPSSGSIIFIPAGRPPCGMIWDDPGGLPSPNVHDPFDQGLTHRSGGEKT